MIRLLLPVVLVFSTLFASSCQLHPKPNEALEVRDFGATEDGTEARVVALRNGYGTEARISTFGATLVSLEYDNTDIVLGFDDAAAYESEENPYFGSTVGRVCNRIREGLFVVDGLQYTLATNNEPNHLHGGPRGFHRVHWQLDAMGRKGNGDAWVSLSYTSPDGEEGYPGQLKVQVQYTLTKANVLRIDYRAESDQRTPVNLTHHSYFNLAGSGTILNHQLQIDAAQYTPTDESLVPTGEIAQVEGSALDFRTPQVVGDRLGRLLDTPAAGYDHNFVLDRGGSRDLQRAAVLSDPGSGRRMEVWTTDIGLQFYSGNWLADLPGKNGASYPQYGGLCLEPQHFPDSVNQPEFPPIMLDPGQVYEKTTEFRLR